MASQKISMALGGETVATNKGGKNQFGKKFGKKHKTAMMEFTKALWLQDAAASLRNLLKLEAGQRQFMKFLATEYSDAQLEFFLEAEKLEALPVAEQLDAARNVYTMFLSNNSGGIGSQDRTAATQQLWDFADTAGADAAYVGGPEALERVRAEADSCLQMMSFDAFPRFLKSKFAKAVISSLQQTGQGAEASQLSGVLQGAGSQLPQDADDWLNMFVTSAETFPACIVISDMTIPGAPMIYVNSEFCQTTGYTKEEATGRNCRFLQGPDTEAESVAVIRNTLAKGQECHVKLTNYRKNGEKFQNLLSMKPVFDMEGIYRYVIGVQFEIREDSNLKQRLINLDKLLRLLPSRLNLKSRAAARTKGHLAAKVDGSVNQMIQQSGVKDAALREGAQQAQAEAQAPQTGSKPKILEAEYLAPKEVLDYTNTIFAFTRIAWLQQPGESVRALISDSYCSEIIGEYVKTLDIVAQDHYQFICEVEDFKNTSAGQRRGNKMRKSFIRCVHNVQFYCTDVEITYGTMNYQKWEPVFTECVKRQKDSLKFLAPKLLHGLLTTKFGLSLVNQLRARELKREEMPVHTIAHGLDAESDGFWLEMFKRMSETAGCAMAVSDMTIPGIPLNHVNDGFVNLFGWSKAESIGRNCRFVTGPKTQEFITMEIVEALRHSEDLCTKIWNYKKNGQDFQCLLCLHPVFMPDGEYKYQIGIQMEMERAAEVEGKLVEMNRILSMLPHSLDGCGRGDIERLIPTKYQEDETMPTRVPSVEAAEKVTKQNKPKMAQPSYNSGGNDGEVMQAPRGGEDVVTRKGKGRTQYGSRFGKKHRKAMLEFTKQLWLQDAVTSLGNLLKEKVAAAQFKAFLATEYADAQLEFYLEATKVLDMKPEQQLKKAPAVYQNFLATGGDGIGKQERTRATAQMWEYANGASDNSDPRTALSKIKEEAASTLQMMAFDAFPRFLKSKFATTVLTKLKSSGKSQAAGNLESMLGSANSQLPQDADDWLNHFVTMAETYPASIVISDMTIPGAPMVFVNNEFSKVTGYTKEEATGRNCRFLQGPDTEAESIAVIRNTLAKGQECHVKLTNYRKTGDKFQNLLSMKPVFDMEGIYRYVIGVQFEVIEDDGLKQRLINLDKLLRLLPSRLDLKSKSEARTKGQLASNVSGEKNQKYGREGEKEQILEQGRQQAQSEQGTRGPRGVYDEGTGSNTMVNYDQTSYAFTKILWTKHAAASIRALLADERARAPFERYIKERGSSLAQCHFDFLINSETLRDLDGAQLRRKARALFKKYDKNEMFYCTMAAIPVGSMMRVNWDPIVDELWEWQDMSLLWMSRELWPQFLNSKMGMESFMVVQQQGSRGDSGIATAATGLDARSPTFWLDMLKRALEQADVGVSVSDMTIPGIPLNWVNEKFSEITGYMQSECIGRSCRLVTQKFDVGGGDPGTELYLNEEIVEALRHADPLMMKIHNYKKSSEKYQMLFCLHPVFGVDGEYRYQIGTHIDWSAPDKHQAHKLAEMQRIMALMPQTIDNSAAKGAEDRLAEMKDVVKEYSRAGGKIPQARSKPQQVQNVLPQAPKAAELMDWTMPDEPVAQQPPTPTRPSGGAGGRPAFGAAAASPAAYKAPAPAAPSPWKNAAPAPASPFGAATAKPPAGAPMGGTRPSPASYSAGPTPAAPMQMQQQQQQMLPQIGGSMQMQNGMGMGMQQAPVFGGSSMGMKAGAQVRPGENVYTETVKQLCRPIAWVVLPGGIRCPIIPDESMFQG